MRGTIVSPYFTYALSFGISLAAYSLRWSDLYPALSFHLLSFIIFTIGLHAAFAFWFHKKKRLSFNKVPTQNSTPVFFTIFIYGLWICEFLYEGGVPLFKIIAEQTYDYKLFGIPSVHVFIVTFSSFYTIYLFHLYLSGKQKLILALYLINLVAGILIYNRGMLLFNISSSMFLYLTYKPRLSLKHFFLGGALLIILSFFFGVMGSLRVSRESKQSYSHEGFLKTGSATEAFKTSSVPSEFFWSYIYITSPMANLQNNINTYQVKPVTPRRFLEFLNNEVLMDFISKRLNRHFKLERENETTIPGPFNVSTVYSRAFSYAGWTGMFFMAGLLLVIPFFYLKLINLQSPFFLTGFSILCTMFLFMAFDNTLRFTGLSFQLVYPLLLHYAIKKSPAFKSLFVNNKVTT